MTTFVYPDWATNGMQWAPADMDIGIAGASLASDSPYNGAVQTAEMVGGHRFLMSLTYPDHSLTERPPVEAFWLRLLGQVHRVSLFDHRRPVPRGTMRGAPTLSVLANQFANHLTIQTTAGATLLAGDWIGAGGQLFMAAADAVADGSGVMVVPVIANVRASIPAGTAIVWDKPRATYMLRSKEVRTPRRGAIYPGFTLDLVENWS